MKTVVIDDERLARVELRRLLEGAHPEVEILGEADDVEPGVRLVEEAKPDLVFLDVRMPGGTGFDLVGRLTSAVPQIIFTTAYEQFALRAFEVNALDYLLKPIAPERLAQALQRAAEPAPVTVAGGPGLGLPALGLHDQVLLRDGQRCWFVRVEEIRVVEAYGNYTYVHFGSDRPLVSRSLAQLEERLPSHAFFRINRQQLVNLNHVEKVEPWFGGALRLKLAGGEECEVSRRAARQLRDRLAL